MNTKKEKKNYRLPLYLSPPTLYSPPELLLTIQGITNMFSSQTRWVQANAWTHQTTYNTYNKTLWWKHIAFCSFHFIWKVWAEKWLYLWIYSEFLANVLSIITFSYDLLSQYSSIYYLIHFSTFTVEFCIKYVINFMLDIFFWKKATISEDMTMINKTYLHVFSECLCSKLVGTQHIEPEVQ